MLLNLIGLMVTIIAGIIAIVGYKQSKSLSFKILTEKELINTLILSTKETLQRKYDQLIIDRKKDHDLNTVGIREEDIGGIIANLQRLSDSLAKIK